MARSVKGADSNGCLTAAQIDSVKKAHGPVKNSKGEIVYPGYAMGGESTWRVLSAANGPSPTALSLGTYREVLHQDPNWDWKTFDVDKDVPAVDEKYGYINAENPDLSAFKARGGKLIMYHGWNDTAISPENSINYYSSVLNKMGAKQDTWYRLFMVPGMAHCGNGPGPNQFNYMGAMERWRESNSLPTDDGVARRQQPCGYDSSAVPVSAGGGVQGSRQHQRCCQLCLQGPIGASLQGSLKLYRRALFCGGPADPEVLRVLLVFLADVLHQLFARGGGSPELDLKRLGVCHRIDDLGFDVQAAQIGPGDAFDGVKLLGMRVPAEIEPEFIVVSDGVDDQCVAVPCSDRIAIPGGIRILQVGRPSMKIWRKLWMLPQTDRRCGSESEGSAKDTGRCAERR